MAEGFSKSRGWRGRGDGGAGQDSADQAGEGRLRRRTVRVDTSEKVLLESKRVDCGWKGEMSEDESTRRERSRTRREENRRGSAYSLPDQRKANQKWPLTSRSLERERWASPQV